MKVADSDQLILPRTLYAKLTRQAQREGVSINSFVTAIIAEAVGSRRAVSQKASMTNRGVKVQSCL
jgi:hypothetical protein